MEGRINYGESNKKNEYYTIKNYLIHVHFRWNKYFISNMVASLFFFDGQIKIEFVLHLFFFSFFSGGKFESKPIEVTKASLDIATCAGLFDFFWVIVNSLKA